MKTGSYTVLHTFTGAASDGAEPDHGGLLPLPACHGLYGLTTYGGQYGQGGATSSSPAGDGVLFRIDTSGHFKLLHSFGDGATDGIGPHGSLVLNHGRLYGMTSSGGAYGYGTVFRIGVNGNGYQVLYSFHGQPADGNDGLDNVFIAGGRIFGMTKYGGSVAGNSSSFQDGVVFSIPLPGR